MPDLSTGKIFKIYVTHWKKQATKRQVQKNARKEKVWSSFLVCKTATEKTVAFTITSHDLHWHIVYACVSESGFNFHPVSCIFFFFFCEH